MTNNSNEKVGYSICQGWLDILIYSSVKASGGDLEKKTQIYAKMDASEIAKFLKKTSQYLLKYLNRGSFEGITGSTQDTVMKLNIAADLIQIVRYAESKTRKGNLALQDLFEECSQNVKAKKILRESMDSLL